MPAKKFIFDVDDVLFDFWETASPIFNQIYGGNFTKKDFVAYDSLTHLYGITYEDFYKTVIGERIIEKIKPYHRVPETIRRFKDLGATIEMITSRDYHPEAFRLTMESFERHGIPCDRLKIKEPGKTKADYIDEPAHVFFDDLPKNLHDVHKEGKAEHVIMISQPWNSEESTFTSFDHIEEFAI